MNGNSNKVLQPKGDVCFVPFYDDNPYQTELARGLADDGITVSSRPWLKGMTLEWVRGKHRPEVIHLHWLPAISKGLRGWMKALGFIARLVLLRMLGARFVWTVHNLYSHEAGSKRAELWETLAVLRLASQVIVHAPSAEEKIREEFGAQPEGKIKVVPHGSYIGVYPSGIGKNEARRDLDLVTDERVLLFLGNIRPYKGVGELVEVFRKREGGKHRLVVAGRLKKTRDVEEMKRLVDGDERILLMPGFIPDEKLQTFMAAADAVVFPYRDVLTSGAVILAMSFGRACVAPRLGCIPDVLDEDGAVLYDPDDPQSGLAGAVREVMEGSGERLTAMGSHNLRKAESWSWDKVGKMTAKVYRQAAGKRGRLGVGVEA